MNARQEAARRCRATPIQEVVDDLEWQIIRKSLIGNWVGNHEANVATLRGYLERHPNDPYAVRRVLNVLTGTVHRAGHTKGQAATDGLRLEVRRAWATMLGEPTADLQGPI